VRIIVDIGLHLKAIIPATNHVNFHPGAAWDFELAVAFVQLAAGQTRERSISEVERYCGLPGQALCYKLGERAILTQRRQQEALLGNRFDLRAFHRELLRFGTVPLDLLPRYLFPPVTTTLTQTRPLAQFDQ
jgi:uncharacterized protein (DUF885 family)